ncbi:hypothetical protein, partial [Acaryochloris sp. IP29b_bin.137]|uniref:hypothetical protein n=1 Tax=Acaryochloris sp. IP29b_bin.137 TaxID=2969217 RepID=UPI00262CC97E
MKLDQDLLYWILVQTEKYSNGYPLVLTNGAQYGRVVSNFWERIWNQDDCVIRFSIALLLLADFQC